MHRIPRAYGSYEELANDPQVEVAYIGSIHTIHYRLGQLMLNGNKHVIIEKPMVLNGKQARHLAEIARSKKLFLMEGIWSRFLPSYVLARDALNRGVIGDVVHVEATLGLPMAHMDRVAKNEFGGGTISNMSVYPLNAVLMAYNDTPPDSVKAIGSLNSQSISR